ncbi:MAG: hypothetical protein IJ793_03470 [Opitutales bacterium]|nr:hypothetical protein [Opitutales bacterium]
MQEAVDPEKYWAYYCHFFSFDKVVSEKDDKGRPIQFEPDAAVITVKCRWLALKPLAQHNETITIDAFDAKDGKFCGYGFYEIEHAKDRKLTRLVLPKGKELTDEEWQEFTNHLWFYFFDKKFKDLICESDKEGCEKLKACAANNRKKDPYPWRGANQWTFESTGKENELHIISWSEIYEKQKDKFLREIGKSNETTKVENYTWLDKGKLAEIVLQISKSESKGHLHVNFDTGGALKGAIRKLLQDMSVADKRDAWILETSEDIDLASLIPYMKTYFVFPYKEEREILFVKDKDKCREYASKVLEGSFKDFKDKDVFKIKPYWLRFCMKEVLEAAAAADSKVKTLRAYISGGSDAQAVLDALDDFCKNTPLQREKFTLQLIASKYDKDRELLEKIVKPFGSADKKSLSNKSIIKAGSVNQMETKETLFGPNYTFLNFIRLEDFFAEESHSWNKELEIDKYYDALPTEALFRCMNGEKQENIHFDVLRDMKKEEVIGGIKSILESEEGRTGWTVHFASEKIANEKTVDEIADAVSKLNKDENKRFVVPMYKDNLFLFVDKDGWTCKQKMEQSEDKFAYEGELKGNKPRELLFLMSLPTSKTKKLVLKDYDPSEHSLKLILDHRNRTGWSLTGGYMRCSLEGKSMCCLSINDKPYAQHFLDEKTFKKEILKIFEDKENAKSLAGNTYDLRNIFDYKASYHAEIYGRGFVSLADALKFAEQLKGGYRTLELKQDFDFMNRCEEKKAAEFMAWITKGLEAICNVEDPGKRLWRLSLKNLSKEQRKQITKLKLDKGAKRELAFSDGDEGRLTIGTRKPFAQRLTKDGLLVLENFDLYVSNFDEIFKSANGLPGLKEVACPENGYESDVAEGIQKVLKSGLNKTWERITFPNEWDIEEIAEEINEKIRDDDLPHKVESETAEEVAGVLILKDLRLPALTTGDHEITFRSEKGSEEKKRVQRLVIGIPLNTWFKDNKENQHAWEDFTEALAEQPQIQYVDFTKLTDKDIHKLYGTIEQWDRLLNIPGTIFKFVSVQSEPNDKEVASYNNLKARKDVAWHFDKTNRKVRLYKDKSMCMKPTKDKIAVTEKGSRLLWNRTALERLFKIRDSNGAKKLLTNDEAKDVSCIDFTIGDPKIEWTGSDGKTKHKWEDVWKFVGSKAFVASLPENGVTIRVYEDCLGNDNRAFLSKNSKDFKYVGKQNGKQMVEITLCSDDAFSTAGETNADDEDDERETKRKRLKKQTREEEEAMERDW